MRTQQSLLREVMMGALLLGAFSASWADETLKVTRLRTDKIALYDCKDGTKKGEYERRNFRDQWPVVSTLPDGLLQVKVGDQQHCVKVYSVETNKPIATSAECGAVVASKQQPKSAATRGLGGECK